MDRDELAMDKARGIGRWADALFTAECRKLGIEPSPQQRQSPLETIALARAEKRNEAQKKG